MRSVAASYAMLRWLCWALVVFVIVSAVLSVGISQNVLVKPPDVPSTTDLVERIAMFRSFDQESNNIYLISNLAGLGVFLIIPLLGVALRPLAGQGSARDVMAVVFIVGGVVGIIAELTIIAVNQAATFGYCDCGYKTEELIAQSYALDVGFAIQSWLATGALTIVGVAAALAGSLINVSSAWRWLSYAIATGLLVAVVLRLFGYGDLATLVTGIASGIGVTIWGIMLARHAGRMTSTDPATS